jgi:CheY-like chemotaxis protein
MATIMIVEDNEHMHRIYADKFRREGYTVVDAFNGGEALTLAPIHKPEVILLDLMMPVMDGYEVMKRLKAIPECASVPLLVISNKSQPVDIERALMLGATKFFHKGMTLLDDLALAVRNLCALRKALVVTARSEVTEPIHKRLVPQGYIISTIAIAFETVSRAERENPDIIFLDSRLPGQNLNHVVQRLSESPKARHVPIIIVDRIVAKDVCSTKRPVVGVLDTPIDPAKLDELVKRCAPPQVQAAA